MKTGPISESYNQWTAREFLPSCMVLKIKQYDTMAPIFNEVMKISGLLFKIY